MIDKHAKADGPEGFLDGHLHCAVFRKRVKYPFCIHRVIDAKQHGEILKGLGQLTMPETADIPALRRGRPLRICSGKIRKHTAPPNLLSRMKIGDVSDVLRTEQGFVILQVTDHKDGSLGSRNIDLLLPALFKRSGIKHREDESSVTFVEDGQLTAGERG